MQLVSDDNKPETAIQFKHTVSLRKAVQSKGVRRNFPRAATSKEPLLIGNGPGMSPSQTRGQDFFLTYVKQRNKRGD
ncbi:hypothetical protein L596_002436 [Steinernema carpocapsae]|uniref:Uncharacterized protein n=1 Tax=Steinernema carpocapsae TaxID=34508 RepID=A0A4U8UPH9_STECR|nr:hypothetical protein L596_002436 [Steinernema carpocapsae]